MPTFKIKMEDHGLAKDFRVKGALLETHQRRFLVDLLMIAKRWIQRFTPRRTGKLKANTKWEVNSDSHGWAGPDMRSTRYARWVIDGRGPIFASEGHYLKFQIAGTIFFRKYVGPAAPNDYVRLAAVSISPEITRKLAVFGAWLENVKGGK